MAESWEPAARRACGEERPALFNPHCVHSTEPWAGSRCVIVAFSFRGTEKLLPSQVAAAEALGFVINSPVTDTETGEVTQSKDAEEASAGEGRGDASGRRQEETPVRCSTSRGGLLGPWAIGESRRRRSTSCLQTTVFFLRHVPQKARLPTGRRPQPCTSISPCVSDAALDFPLYLPNHSRAHPSPQPTEMRCSTSRYLSGRSHGPQVCRAAEKRCSTSRYLPNHSRAHPSTLVLALRRSTSSSQLRQLRSNSV